MTVGIILLIITISSLIYHLLTVYCSDSFRRDTLRDQIKARNIKKWPKVVCIKPLCGLNKRGFFNILSFMKLDYPDYMVLIGVADSRDPAFEIAKSIKKHFPYQVILSVGEEKSGANRKVRNLMHMEKYLPPDTEIVIISDSDITVEKDYIKCMVLPFLDDPKLGATTSIYNVRADIDVPELIEGLYVETNFIPGVLLACRFADVKYAFGASIAVRMEVLKKIGGFAALKDYLADDYMLARKIIEAGYKIKLAPYVVSTIPTVNSIKEALLHVLRWNRTIKICNPWGYFFSGICYFFVWGVITCFYFDAAIFAMILFLVGVFIRMLCAAFVSTCIDSDPLRAIFIPVWEVVSFFIWMWAFFGDRVKWRDRVYKVFPDGRMIETE